VRRFAGVAQLVEHLICNQRVGGSNPFASSSCRRPQKSAPAQEEYASRKSFRFFDFPVF
jgi:hypothetical protein